LDPTNREDVAMGMDGEDNNDLDEKEMDL